MDPIQKVVVILGSKAALAKVCGVSHQAASKWVERGRCPATKAIAIERATKGAVSRYELRPDIFCEK